MPWDVFISHASEDKQAVAVPLKGSLEAAGVSVWMDMDQIAAGQGLRRRIDHGLANSRFTVIVASRPCTSTRSGPTRSWTRPPARRRWAGSTASSRCCTG